MPDQPRTAIETSAEKTDRERLVEDLERRIEAIETLDDSHVGSFTTLDWFFCIAGSIVIPVIALWFAK